MTDLIAKTTQVLRQAGVNPGALSMRALGGRRGSTLYRVHCAGGCFALKQYISLPGDRRDRMGAEYATLTHLRQVGNTDIPRCIGFDRRDQLALFTWVDGVPVERADAHTVELAGRFFASINRGRDRQPDLPPAFSASFSITGALEEIERRLSQLMHAPRDLDLDRSAAAMADALTLSWSKVKANTLTNAREAGLDEDADIVAQARCISRSDFDLHSALRVAGDRLTFVDFAQAGWDDPARAVAEFFCQQNIPVSLRYWDLFTQQALVDFPDREQILKRALVLLPAVQLRSYADALSDFMRTCGERRRHAPSPMDTSRTRLRRFRLGQAFFSTEVA